MTTASSILNSARSTTYDEDKARATFQLYKIILADRWDELSRKERLFFVQRMFYAVYGSYTNLEMARVWEKAKETDIYKYAQSQDRLVKDN